MCKKNVMTSEGESAVHSYARSVAGHYGNTVSNWVIGNGMRCLLRRRPGIPIRDFNKGKRYCYLTGTIV